MEYRTKTGRVLSDAEIEALADEAERGYDVSALVLRERAHRVAAELRALAETPELFRHGTRRLIELARELEQ